MEISRADEMMKYVEGYYQESRLYMAHTNAKGAEFDRIHAIIEDLPNQFVPQKATWAAGFWEELLGLDGRAGNLEERRRDIMRKLLMIQRITPISLERLIKKLSGVKVDVVRNVAPYTFQVRIDEDNLSCDNKLVRMIVEDYKEAHMAFYQVYFLGPVISREKFYFRTVHKIVMHWFRKRVDKCKLINRFQSACSEHFHEPVVMIWHNLWYLDGEVGLDVDGSRILDAYESKEVLE